MSIKHRISQCLQDIHDECDSDITSEAIDTIAMSVAQLQEPQTLKLNPMSEPPEPGQIVILWRRHRTSGKVSWVKAKYVRFRELTADPEYWGDGADYDEENDEYYCIEGWYEFSHSNDDCESWLMHYSDFELLGWIEVPEVEISDEQ